MTLVGSVGAATAQEAYPTRPITIVVSCPPGRLADLTVRPVAAAFEPIPGQPVVVLNKPGPAAAELPPARCRC